MLSRKSALALFAFFLLSVTSAVAQTDRGSLTGRVTDPNGAGVANAKVTATNLNTNETREVTTSDEGNYTIPELKPDPYKVTAEAPGFKTASAENIVVAVQVNRTLDFKLEVGEISTVVTITNNEAPVLQTETPVRQTNVTERQVRELPLLVSSEFSGRTPLSFIYLDTIFIKAVNTSRTSALLTSVTIEGAIPAARAEIKTVTAPSLSVANDFSRPDAVTIQSRTLASGRRFLVTLPKHSVSVIVLKTQ